MDDSFDLDSLTDDWGDTSAQLPDIVSGRVSLLDADRGAYQVAKLDKPAIENFQDFMDWIEYRRLLCGAESVIPFLTMGAKGGRNKVARVKKYQGNRSGRDPLLSQRIHELRYLLAERDDRCIAATTEEADDVICQYQTAALARGDSNHVIDADDKDLRMIPGKHLCPVTLDIVDVHGYGACELVENNSGTKEIKGWGTSFFWYQMLIGDTADNIPGLPKLSGWLANEYKPTQTTLKAQRVLQDELATEAQRARATDVLSKRGAIPCGPATAALILQDVDNDYEAMTRVFRAYRSYWGAESFRFGGWDGVKTTVLAGHMILEQARLLWMRRVPRECPSTFFKEIIDANVQ